MTDTSIKQCIDDGRKAAILDFYEGKYNPIDMRKAAIQQMAFWDAYIKEINEIIQGQEELCLWEPPTGSASQEALSEILSETTT